MNKYRAAPFLRALRARLQRLTAGPKAGDNVQPALRRLTPEQLAEVHSFFRREKFFIFGYPRSGKTLLARLARLHPEVHCNWHARFFNERRDLLQHLDISALESWLERKSNHWTYQQGLAAPMIRVLCDFVLERDAARAGKPIVGDETPNHNNGAAVERLQQVYPDARLLWVVRDGRDAVLFRRIQLFIDKPQILTAEELAVREALQADKSTFFSAKKSIFTEDWLAKSARDWAANVRETDALARSLYGDRYLAIRYEDLITDPVSWMRRVWAFLGASDQSLDTAIEAQVEDDLAAAWLMEKNPALLEGLDPAEIGAWRRVFTPGDLALFISLAGPELGAWRYELGEQSSGR